ncbi:hypothetical protein RI129_005246 [Pyrocoelia pectoralis]|uniref:Uncharacterized protein n=1 Tax=Pyrocoelia pectoralis TaxID=417401 RepID=A0AAN7VFD3_9COLE
MALKKIVTYIDEDRNTSLHYLAAAGDLEKIKAELENSEIDPGNYLGWTPLMMAARYGHIDVIKYLLEIHADATRINSFGCNILLTAVASGNVDVISVILQHLLLGGISKQSMQNIFSPISLAILFDNIDIVKYLIEKGFCVNISTPVTELTPITFANTMRNAEIIRLLQSKGAKGENKLEGTQTPLSHHYSNAPRPLIFVNPNRPTLFCVSPMSTTCSDLSAAQFAPTLSPISPLFFHNFFFPQNFPQYSNSDPYEANVDVENSRVVHNPYLSPSYYPSH